MISVLRPTAAGLSLPVWSEMRRLWRQDAIRRRHQSQLEDVRRSLILGQLTLFLAWDNEPFDRGEWGGPRYCLGIVIALPSPPVLRVEWAAGRAMKRWTGLAAQSIEAFARATGCNQLEIFCRKGWKQELGSLWTFPREAVTLRRDPEVLHVDVHQAVMAGSA